MKKIATIFDRDRNGNKGVIDKWSDDLIPHYLQYVTATEKVDGTNVRLTVRNHTLVRLEKRCNPSKIQKNQGIADPWYVDAIEGDAQDKYIWEAARNTNISSVFDGEWSAEALGPKIQGNPLNLEKHICCIFSDGGAPVFEDVPTAYNELKEWLLNADSKFGAGKIEGIVWHCNSTFDRQMFKIKTKDFK